MRFRIHFIGVAFVALCFDISDSNAYQFTPTDQEWQSWPLYCQAKYVWTNIGKGSKFAKRVGPVQAEELSIWERAGISGLHHYCAGMHWLNRARFEKDSDQRRFMLRSALNETQFTFDRSNRSASQFSDIAIQLATILYEKGERGAAIEVLEDLIPSQPQNGILYSAAAVMKRKAGQLAAAKEILLKGHEATKGESAEINYNLGLVSLELGQLDDAVRYAESAYELGYPLPGLRTKLAKLGRM